MGPIRVVKVGGSLLDLPDLAPRLRKVLLTDDRAGVNVLIPGGGALADCIRRYDATFQFPSRFIHEVAIETMRITARLLAELLKAPLIDEVDGIADAAARSRLVVLDVDAILKREPQASGTRLKSEWSVTSDSISARIATLIGADELWLLKSVSAAGSDAQSLAGDGVVDPEFPRYAKDLRWRIVNLREVSGSGPTD